MCIYVTFIGMLLDRKLSGKTHMIKKLIAKFKLLRSILSVTWYVINEITHSDLKIFATVIKIPTIVTVDSRTRNHQRIENHPIASIFQGYEKKIIFSFIFTIRLELLLKLHHVKHFFQSPFYDIEREEWNFAFCERKQRSSTFNLKCQQYVHS